MIKGFTVHLDVDGRAACGVKARGFRGRPGISKDLRRVTCRECEKEYDRHKRDGMVPAIVNCDVCGDGIRSEADIRTDHHGNVICPGCYREYEAGLTDPKSEWYDPEAAR